MTHRGAATVVAATLIAAACSGSDAVLRLPVTTTASDELATSNSSSPSVVAIAQVDCPSSLESDLIACGTAAVPLDRRDPNSPTEVITIALHQGYDRSFDTPVAVLQGGPGGASTDMAAWFPQQPFTQVFIDQRGTGFAGPDFNCGEFDEALPSILEAAATKAAELVIEAFDSCARRLADDPLLGTTTTQNHAADVAAVMTGLGYDRWVAYGISYGSTIGFELLREPPSGLAGVVLDGVYPPSLDVDAAIPASAEQSMGAVADACAASAICSDYTADLRDTLDRVIAQLDKTPMTVTLSGNESGTGETIDVVLDGVRLAEFTFQTLYSEAQVRYLPAVLAAIEDGDSRTAHWFVATATRAMISTYRENSEATFFGVQCHDRLPFAGKRRLDLNGFAAAVTPIPLAVLCEAWEHGTASEIAGSAVSSGVPALLLSGEFDPITPPRYAAAAAQTLSASTVVTQAGRGHGIWFGSECIASIVEAFVADPTSTLDTECANHGVPVNWAQP